MKRHETVDEFLEEAEAWRPELEALRAILLDTPLEETLKWGSPVYTHTGKNVVGIGGFKSYFGLWFFQGALLKDPASVLINAQEGTTKAMRQLRYDSREAIDRDLVHAYVREAMALIDQGIEIKPERKKELAVPQQLAQALDRDPAARRGFDQLTPGKQREYSEYLLSAKREETKAQRLAKILPLIETGVGLNDKYR